MNRDQAARTLQSFVLSGLYYGHPLHLVGISESLGVMHEILGRAVDFLQAHSLKAETHVLPLGPAVADPLQKWVLVTDTSPAHNFVDMNPQQMAMLQRMFRSPFLSNRTISHREVRVANKRCRDITIVAEWIVWYMIVLDQHHVAVVVSLTCLRG